MQNILELNHSEAKEFFLKEESYFTFDLPKYFKFSNLLQGISNKLNGIELSEFYAKYCEAGKEKTQYPSYFEGVNYRLLNNKDGEYAWRLFQLIHPALYVALVHKITEDNSWRTIIDKFKEFKGGAVECGSLPVIKSEKQKSDKAEQIHTWWEKIEQKSIILALEYDYIFHADIVDCYGSIYTHSISWALHTKGEAKKIENRKKCSLIGVIIDKSLQSMANGQTNGIPQGSVLMDFLAEIILGFADLELTKKIESISRDDYKIIRYRDDYRIFVNNPEVGRKIIKELTDVLSEIGMRLNSEKTKLSNDVIIDSIKADKLFWITNAYKNNNLEKQLLSLYFFSKKYPNSGTLTKELQKFYGRIEKRKSINRNMVLISILVNIAFKNPKTYPVASAILSKLLTFEDCESKKEIIEKMKVRFKKLPNIEHLELWLQRITLKINDGIVYDNNLCKKVSDASDSIEIWNSDWLNDEFKQIISSLKIIDQKEIENMQSTISNEEVAVFDTKSYY